MAKNVYLIKEVIDDNGFSSQEIVGASLNIDTALEIYKNHCEGALKEFFPYTNSPNKDKWHQGEEVGRNNSRNFYLLDDNHSYNVLLIVQPLS